MEKQWIGKDAACEFLFLIIFVVVYFKLVCQFIITALFLLIVRLMSMKLSVVI